MKRFVTLLVFFSVFFFMTYAQAKMDLVLYYDLLFSVFNKTDQVFYFGTCEKPIFQQTASLCALPQKIVPGLNNIYVPRFKVHYPVFTTEDETVFTCGTQDQPEQQLPLTSRGIIVDSFILDKDNNRVALNCQAAKLSQ